MARSSVWRILAATALTVATPALADMDALIGQAATLQAKGQANAAYMLLAPHQAQRAGDPDFDYALGLAAADSRRPAQAIAAFQRVLAVQPANAQARAELARVYAQAGDIDTARATFNTVVADPTVPDPVRQRLNGLIRDFDREIGGGGNELTGYVDGEFGYDSNVNSATSLNAITLPVFAFLGPAALTGPARRDGDEFYQVQGGLSGSTAVSRQDRLFLSALGSFRDNIDSRAFDQAAATVTAGGSHALVNGDAVSLSVQGQRFWLGHDGFRTGVGAIGQYTKRLSNGRALAFQSQYFRFDYDGDRLRDAHRYAATITYADRTSFAGLGGGYERTVRAGARQLGYKFAAGQAGTEWPVAANLAVLAGASVEHRDYDVIEPLFLRSRKDTQLDATLGLRLAIAKGVTVRPRVTLTRNFSNLSLYDYSRVTGSAALRLEF